MDHRDIDILRALLEDSRLSVRQLAAKVHRSPTPVYERLKRMEQEGVIQRYTILVNEEAVGRGFTVLCNVRLKHISTDIHQAFSAEINAMPEVTECYNVSGEYDYVLKVQVPDMKSYRYFVTERLGRLPMLDSVHSVFVMDKIKHEPGLSLMPPGAEG